MEFSPPNQEGGITPQAVASALWEHQAHIQEHFSRGRGVGQAQRSENSLDNFFYYLFFIYFFFFWGGGGGTEGIEWFYYRENYTFPRIQRGSNIFQGVQLFSRGGGGPNANFYRNPYNL